MTCQVEGCSAPARRKLTMPASYLDKEGRRVEAKVDVELCGQHYDTIVAQEKQALVTAAGGGDVD